MIVNRMQALKLIEKYSYFTKFMSSELEDVLNGITVDAREICYTTPLKIKEITIGYRSAVDLAIEDFSEQGTDTYYAHAEDVIDEYLHKGELSEVLKQLQRMADAALKDYDDYIILLED